MKRVGDDWELSVGGRGVYVITFTFDAAQNSRDLLRKIENIPVTLDSTDTEYTITQINKTYEIDSDNDTRKVIFESASDLSLIHI